LGLKSVSFSHQFSLTKITTTLGEYLSTKVCLTFNGQASGWTDYETTKIQRGTEKVAGTPAILSLCETQEQEKVH